MTQKGALSAIATEAVAFVAKRSILLGFQCKPSLLEENHQTDTMTITVTDVTKVKLTAIGSETTSLYRRHGYDSIWRPAPAPPEAAAAVFDVRTALYSN